MQCKAGAHNLAGGNRHYLLRHPGSCIDLLAIAEDTKAVITCITQCSIPKAITFSEISEATTAYQTLQGCCAMIRTGHWEAMTRYKPIKDEITIGSNNIILSGSRIIIPHSLHQRAVDFARECHHGVSTRKALLQEKVWFPGMDELQ